MKDLTFRELVRTMEARGENLADYFVGRMMTIIEEETGTFPDWSDKAPDWVVENCGVVKPKEKDRSIAERE